MATSNGLIIYIPCDDDQGTLAMASVTIGSRKYNDQTGNYDRTSLTAFTVEKPTINGTVQTKNFRKYVLNLDAEWTTTLTVTEPSKTFTEVKYAGTVPNPDWKDWTNQEGKTTITFRIGSSSGGSAEFYPNMPATGTHETISTFLAVDFHNVDTPSYTGDLESEFQNYYGLNAQQLEGIINDMNEAETADFRGLLAFPFVFPDDILGAISPITFGKEKSTLLGSVLKTNKINMLIGEWNITEKYTNYFNYGGAIVNLTLPFADTPISLDLALITNHKLTVRLRIDLGSTNALYLIYIDDILQGAYGVTLGRNTELVIYGSYIATSSSTQLTLKDETLVFDTAIDKAYLTIERTVPVRDPLGFDCLRHNALNQEHGYVRARGITYSETIPDNHKLTLESLLSNGVYLP